MSAEKFNFQTPAGSLNGPELFSELGVPKPVFFPNLVVCNFYAETLFCALLKTYVLRSFALICTLFARICVFLRPTAFGNCRMNCFSCGICYQKPFHSCFYSSEKALFFTDFCFVASPSPNSVPTCSLRCRKREGIVLWGFQGNNLF